MLFRRRKKPSLWQTIIGWLWPRSGFRRAGLYIWHRVLRLPGTEHSIAAGLASGAAVSFTPFLGFHFLMGFALAGLLRGNLVASAIGTVVGNPWTFPFIFALTEKVGEFMLRQDVSVVVPVWDWGKVMDAPIAYLSAYVPLVLPMFVGSIPVAFVVWVIFYFVVRKMVAANRARKHAKKQMRLAKLQEQDSSEKA